MRPGIRDDRYAVPSNNINLKMGLILYDARCTLCLAWRRFLLRADTVGHFTLCPLQSAKGRRVLARLTEDSQLQIGDTLVLIMNRQVLTRSSAIIAILAQLPFPWRLGAVFKWIPHRLRDRLYRLVARHRHRVFGTIGCRSQGISHSIPPCH